MTPQLRLIVTERCNLDCEYCHKATLPPIDTEAKAHVAAALLSQFAGYVSTKGHDSAELSLYGGEPLLNGSLIEEALRTVERMRAHGFRYEVILNTNATRITPDLAHRLAEAEVDVHASLDGADDLTNGLRLNFAGHSSAGMAKRGIRFAREAGCRVQLNTVVTRQNVHGLERLLDYAVSAGADRMFVALADDRTDLGDVDDLARRLLTLNGSAQGRLHLLGPWRSGLGSQRPAAEWPPLSINALGSGELFFSHFPDQLQPGIEQAFASDTNSRLGEQWADVMESCEACPIVASCRGYLKMMIRYHHGDQMQQEMECSLARTVAALSQDPEFELVRSSVDLRLRRVADGRVEIQNPLLPNSRLLASDDVVRILSTMTHGGNLASLRQWFEAGNIGEVFALLRSRRLLAAPESDTDQLLFAELATVESRFDASSGLRLGAANDASLRRWEPLLPYLKEAKQRLPRQLRNHSMALCLFGASDEAEMASALGIGEDSPHLRWMAATVLHSILVFNLKACEQLVGGGGRKVIAAFVQQCTHEFVHLALRQWGVRLPVWLEEGFCEYLSGAPLTPESSRYAAQLQPHFCEFLQRIHSGELDHDTSLLEFSGRPVGENPAYHLAHDFVRFLAEAEGIEALLDRLRGAGVGALLDPFPLAGAKHPVLANSLSSILEAWTADLTRRVSSAPTTEGLPMRLMIQDGRAAMYNRMLGGVAMLGRDDSRARDWTGVEGRNVTLAEALQLFGSGLSDHPMYPSWESEVNASRRALHLRLMLQNACNMRCTYCYKGDFLSQAMTTETADRAIRTWRDLLEPGERERATVRLFGGEPLLNWKLVEHVVEVMKDWKETALILNTNGTLLRSEHVRAFQGLNGRMRVVLSCDGIEEVNDLVRLDAAGRGTFRRVDSAARMLCEARIPLALNAVVGANNYHGLIELARFVASLKSQYDAPVILSLELVVPPPRDPEVGQAIVNACVETVAFCHENGLPLAGTMTYPFEALLDPNGASGYYCAAAGSEMIVGPTGELMHCPAVRSASFATLDAVAELGAIPDPLNWQQRRGGNMPGCRGCEVEGLCGGGCAAHSQASSGDIFKTPEPLFCDVTRAVFRTQLKLAMAAAGPIE